jgi:hypothetical protein
MWIGLILFAVGFWSCIIAYKLGYNNKHYIVNYYTKEIHSASSKDKRCKIHNMTNCQRIGRLKVNKLLKNGYNGCRYCLPEFDTDLIDYKKNTEKK